MRSADSARDEGAGRLSSDGPAVGHMHKAMTEPVCGRVGGRGGTHVVVVYDYRDRGRRRGGGVPSMEVQRGEEGTTASKGTTRRVSVGHARSTYRVIFVRPRDLIIAQEL